MCKFAKGHRVRHPKGRHPAHTWVVLKSRQLPNEKETHYLLRPADLYYSSLSCIIVPESQLKEA